MSEDSSTIAALARIEAGMGHLSGAIEEVKSDGKEVATAVGAMTGQLIRLEERQMSHERDDDRRHDEQQADIDRAHNKIAQIAPRTVTSYGAPLPEPETPEPEKRSKVGWISGVLAGLGAGGAAFAKWWTGEG
ncbi:MAG: hypothetical protein WBG86_06325 [Polyangiales bacterium]